MKVGVYNDAGEPLGFDYVYESDSADLIDEWYDEENYNYNDYDEEEE